MIDLDDAFLEQVYAGVLGKVIGVYLGRPFEGLTYQELRDRLGIDIHYYVHDRMGVPLIVTDDDITGTFTFVRALADHGMSFDIAPEHIGRSWLNYLIENRTVLWWGGLGNSTEHTAYLRLKAGIPAPKSGSSALNSVIVSEQIGAQIFIDGWAMALPGEAARAADLARRAGSVSHDGEALHAAAAWAAMEAEAFVRPDTDHLVETALGLIPRDSIIARVIEDLRQWCATDDDWRVTRERVERDYGYDRYGGNVHVVPNHALMHLGLHAGGGDFQRSLMIVNTAGWDTDCNSGNLGCLLGIQGGLAAIDAGPDWRGPVADRLYLPTADGSRSITDAARESIEIANLARGLRGENPHHPKDGARFHFALPGSVQGFTLEAEMGAAGILANSTTPDGGRALAIQVTHLGSSAGLRVTTPTFIPPDARDGLRTYELLASPTLYPGQRVVARVVRRDGSGPIEARIVAEVYDDDDDIREIAGDSLLLQPGDPIDLEYLIPETGGHPVASVGIRLTGSAGSRGRVDLDHLDWRGAPETTWVRPARGEMWRRGWIDAVSHFQTRWADEGFRAIQNEGTGLLTTGAAWADLRLDAEIRPHLASRAGLVVRAVGLHRYAAVVVTAENEALAIVRDHESEVVLARIPLAAPGGPRFRLTVEVQGDVLSGWVDGQSLGPVTIPRAPRAGAVGLLVADGLVGTDAISISRRLSSSPTTT